MLFLRKMKIRRLLGIAIGGLVFLAGPASGFITLSNHPLSPESEARRWTLAASVYAFCLPDGQNYLMPTLTADRKRLHLEVRYNYEDLKTGALFMGGIFSMGDKLSLDITPMLGVVLGDTWGIAPGMELTLSYGRIELYSEGEYVFNLSDSSESFFYNWSEVTWALADWLRLGLVAQRTKVHQKTMDVQEGLLVGVSLDQLKFSAHLFNPGSAAPTFIFSVEYDF